MPRDVFNQDIFNYLTTVDGCYEESMEVPATHWAWKMPSSLEIRTRACDPNRGLEAGVAMPLAVCSTMLCRHTSTSMKKPHPLQQSDSRAARILATTQRRILSN
ncbi:hypothetical protein NS2R_10315 [Pseudomonas oryzihabitans]|nr:hypothetical protein NS2R_10315 [Pseudomonas psychrotolerans]